MDKKLIGIDLGGTTVKFAILTPEGEIQQRWAEDTNINDDGAHIVPDIIESINHHLSMYQMDAGDFSGIGMGSPGSIDYANGTVTGAFNLNWDNTVNVKKEIEAGVGINVNLENDANVAALGEAWKGAGNNAENVVFVTLGTGVGGGIIMNNQILHGIAGSAGEIGHITIDKHGYKCTCGKVGCLETVSSATGIVRVARDMSEEFAGTSKLKQMLDEGEEVTAKTVFDSAREKDTLGLRIVERVCDDLGYALAMLGNSLNPSYIVIGGGVSAAGELLLNTVRKYFEKYTFPNVKNTTKVELATLGNEAGVIGAASLVVKG